MGERHTKSQYRHLPDMDPIEKNIPASISNKQRKLEILAVFLTGAGKFVFMDLLQWRFVFITVAILGWTFYVIYQNKRIPGIMKYWGFRTDTFKEVTRMIVPFGIVAIVTFFIVGYIRHTINMSWHIIPVLFLYPLWGIVQQFLVIGLVAGNLHDLKISLNKYLIILITAILFGLLHYPHWWLVLGTFVLALLYGFIYLKSRNVYVMGIFHGWLGGLFFYTVVGRDPFGEVFGLLVH
jgi:membrane protease YdiL (CAAX protease family)